MPEKKSKPPAPERLEVFSREWREACFARDHPEMFRLKGNLEENLQPKPPGKVKKI